MKSYYLVTLEHSKPLGNISKDIAQELDLECFLGKEITHISVQKHIIIPQETNNATLKGRNPPELIRQQIRDKAKGDFDYQNSKSKEKEVKTNG